MCTGPHEQVCLQTFMVYGIFLYYFPRTINSFRWSGGIALRNTWWDKHGGCAKRLVCNNWRQSRDQFRRQTWGVTWLFSTGVQWSGVPGSTSDCHPRARKKVYMQIYLHCQKCLAYKKGQGHIQHPNAQRKPNLPTLSYQQHIKNNNLSWSLGVDL